MSKRKWTNQQFIKAVASSLSYAEVLQKLGLRPAGSNYATVKRKISELDLDVSHMTGQAWNQGDRYKPIKQAKPLSEILVEHSNYISSHWLRKRLIKEKIKKQVCECCGRSEWLGKPISLELHHINGVKDDLRIENLQILCPNCHSFTDNYRGKSIRIQNKTKLSALSETKDVECRKFKEALTENADGNLEPSLNSKEGAETRHDKPKSKKSIVLKHCLYCGKELKGHERRNKYCSVECYRENTKGKRPPVLELIKSFKQYKSYVQVGKHYGVSDNAVRKWVKLYQIEDMVKE